MTLPELAIKRPVTMLMVLVSIAACVGFEALGAILSGYAADAADAVEP